VSEKIADLHASNVVITSLVSKGPVAYFSTEDGRFGVLRPTSRRSWTWV
jgi:hypothetical protein